MKIAGRLGKKDPGHLGRGLFFREFEIRAGENRGDQIRSNFDVWISLIKYPQLPSCAGQDAIPVRKTIPSYYLLP